MNKSPREIYAQRPVRSDFARRSAQPAIRVNMRKAFMSFVVAVLAICLVYGVMWMLGSRDSADKEIPIITARENVKERPADEGGIDIPHQDVDVFQRLDNQGAAGGSEAFERLLPEPEEPNVSAAQTDSVAMEELSEELPPAVTDAGEEAAPEPQAPAQDSVPEVKQETPKKAESKAKETASRLPASLFTAPEKAAATGRQAQIQLGSYKDGDVASKEVLRLEKSLAGSLKGASLRVVQADLGSKGIFYRVMSSSLPEQDAKNICETIKAQKGNCLVVR
ncbi:MAG: hypothetical protein FWF24_07430 [Alphaproteobacteria bacterium]|nr:hypothetical protein [Alphaproteobacteria bacterium]